MLLEPLHRVPIDAAAAFDAELSDLLLFLWVELENREQHATPSPSPATDDRTDEVNGDVPKACVMHIASIARLQCFFCQTDQHGTRSCHAVIPLEVKKEQLQKDNRYFRCSLKGHKATKCRVKLTCSSCHGRHASSMCNLNYKRASITAGTSGSATVCILQMLFLLRRRIVYWPTTLRQCGLSSDSQH